jgi:hypothetical protein
MGAKSARDRKLDFDRAMRNQGRSLRPDQPERTPCVLYLSAEARSAISRNRELDRAVGAKPLTDSAFVERAILLHGKKKAPPVKMTSAVRQLTKARETIGALLRATGAHESQLVALNFQIERLKSQIAEKGMLARHRSGLTPAFLEMHEAVRKVVVQGHRRLDEARAVHALIAKYIQQL